MGDKNLKIRLPRKATTDVTGRACKYKTKD